MWQPRSRIFLSLCFAALISWASNSYSLDPEERDRLSTLESDATIHYLNGDLSGAINAAKRWIEASDRIDGNFDEFNRPYEFLIFRCVEAGQSENALEACESLLKQAKSRNGELSPQYQQAFWIRDYAKRVLTGPLDQQKLIWQMELRYAKQIDAGQTRAAIETYAGLIGIEDKILGENHPVSARSRKSIVEDLLGVDDPTEADFDRALKHAHDAVTILRNRFGKSFLNKHAESAGVLSSYAQVLYEQSQFEAAAKEFRRAARAHDKMHHLLESAREYEWSGLCLSELGNYSKAEGDYRRSLELYAQIEHEDNLTYTILQYARILSHFERYPEAISQFVLAESAYRSVDEADRETQTLGEILLERAEAHIELEQFGDALRQLRAAKEVFDECADQINTAWALSGMGTCYAKLDQPATAESYLRESISEFAKHAPEENLAFQWYELGELLSSMDRHSEAIDAFQKADSAYLEADDKVSAAYMLDWIGDSYESLGDDQQAARSFKQCLDRFASFTHNEELAGIRERFESIQKRLSSLARANEIPGPNDKMSMIVHLLRDGESMLVTTESAQVKVETDVLGTVPSGARLYSLGSEGSWHRIWYEDQIGFVHTSRVIDLKGKLYEELMYSLALQALTDSRLLADVEKFENNFEQIKTLFSRGDIEAATTLAEENVELAKQFKDGEHYAVGIVLKDLGDMYIQQKRGKQAASTIREAIRQLSKYLGADHPSTAYCQYQLAEILFNNGDSSEATQLYQLVMRTLIKWFGPEEERTNFVRGRMAVNYLESGDFGAARRACEKVLEIENRSGRSDSAIVINCEWALSRLLIEIGQPRQAMPHIERCMALLEKNEQSDSEAFGLVLASLAWARASLGDYSEAIDAMTRALPLVEAEAGKTSSTYAALEGELGMLKMAAGDFNSAMETLQTCLRRVSERFGENHAMSSEVRHYLGSLFFEKGDVNAALTQITLARQLCRRFVHSTLADMAPTEQVNFIRRNDAVALHASLAFATRDKSQKVLQDTATWWINGKALAHETAAQQTGLRRLLRTDDQAALFRQWRAVRRRIETDPNGPLGGGSQADNTKTLQQRRLELEQKLGRDFQLQLLSHSDPWIPLQRVRDALSKDEVLIDIAKISPAPMQSHRISRTTGVENENVYVAWVIPRNGDLQFVKLGTETEIETELTLLRKTIADSIPLIREKGQAAATKIILKNLERVSDLVWQPLKQCIGNSKKIILSPDAGLWLLPWAALPIEGDVYLVEEYELRFINSGRDLVAKQNEFQLSSPIILADAAFDADQKDLTPHAPSRIQSQSAASLKGIGRVRRLPGTRLEALAIRESLEKFAGRSSELRLGDSAVEGVFKRAKQPHSVVLSTHGFFIKNDKPGFNTTQLPTSLLEKEVVIGQDIDYITDNPLLRCGVLLAGCNKRDHSDVARDDGILTGAEIVETDLRGTKLVVLSACDTAIGVIADGEGVAGLSQAFQLAGARNVLSTLWEIDDAETAKLVVGVFEELSKQERPAAALRSSQLKRIESRRKRYGVAHPIYWAAFTAIGKN